MKITQKFFALALRLAITNFKSPALSYAAKTISLLSNAVTCRSASIEHKGVREKRETEEGAEKAGLADKEKS
jgi:hypothetical protein